MKITLDTKEDVQAFFDVLNKLQGEKKNDWNLLEYKRRS
jgi:hypothetical protein